jgi:hypothetical protein
MGGRDHKSLLCDNNILRDNVRFSPRECWTCYVPLNPDNTGDGTFSNNKFFLRPGKHAFGSKPACFNYVNNDEDAKGTFAEMPLVTNIKYGKGSRTYTLSCKTDGATIRYTMDGSLPNSSSPEYTQPITVKRSCALNAKAFIEGSYPSYDNCIVVEMRNSEGDSPFAWWKLDEESGATVKDSAGQNSGSLVGCTRTAEKLGNCLEFNGNSDSVDIDTTNLKTISDTFTVSFWAYAGARRSRTDETGTGVAGQSGQQYALGPVWTAAGPDAGIGISVGTNGVSVFEPTLYLNGVLEKAGCQSTKTVHPVFNLGGIANGWYTGKLKDVHVYNRALTDAEVQVLASF